jgi:hypothetical protein
MQRVIDVARAASTSRARGKLIAELASNFDTDALESLLQRFLSIDACNVLQLDLNELISQGEEGENETEVDAKGSGGLAPKLAPSHRRDRLRRLAESLIGPLLRLRWIGNQEACPEAKKLHRRLSRFLEIPARAAAFRSGLFREGSMRPLDADLAQRAPLLREHARQLAATHTIMVIEDNAPLVEISAAGAGETVNANMSHWTATGWSVSMSERRISIAARRAGRSSMRYGKLPQHSAAWLAEPSRTQQSHPLQAVTVPPSQPTMAQRRHPGWLRSLMSCTAMLRATRARSIGAGSIARSIR